MSEVIAIANQKGGVGKTMTSVSLSACLALNNKKVLLLDLDPQGHSTKAFGFYDSTQYPLSMKDVIVSVIEDIPLNREQLILHSNENVDIVPSNISLAGINSKLESAMCRETVLKRFIDTVKDDYDYVIIDTNPSLDNLPINALTASDKVVITVQAEPYAVEGMADLLRSINMVRRNLNHDLKIEGVLITMTNERTNLSKKITHEVRENFGGHIKVFDTTIPRCTKAAESTGIGESIFQYDPKGAATKAYEAFTKEVILNAEKEHKRHKSSTYDDLFTNEEQRQEAKLEKIMEVPVEDIQEFKNHPFRVRNDEQMSELVKSVSENGILVPVLVRPHPNGHGYEMISGHRRMNAAMVNGQEKIQAIVRELTDDQATIIMVDSNIQRENILPTERGFAYKLKLDAMKHQGKRSDITSTQVGQKLKNKYSIEQLAEDVGNTRTQIQRFIRLTELIEPLRDMVDGLRSDGKKIAFNPAVELSYLSKENQQLVVKNIEGLDLTPSHAQTIRMKELSRENRLDENVIYSIMTEEKANQKEKLSFKMEDINEYFPKNYTPREKSEVILKLLKGWAKRRNKEQER